jgi:predicted lactoylglutathione lyase
MSLFLNIPVANLQRSRAFYTALGWSINENFSDDNAACIVLDNGNFLMILSRDYYATFLDGRKSVGDPASTSLAMISFDLPSREAVDAFAERAAAAGATMGKAVDLSFMYQWQFDDPDGNHFEPFWMDPAAAESGPPAE